MHTMSPKRRVTGIALSDSDAQTILSEHVAAAGLEDPSKCFAYGVGLEANLWKRAPRWEELYRHRSFLEDVADKTGGRLLKHSAWLSAMNTFLENHKGHNLKHKDVSRVVYRSRAMMAHLRDARRDHKSPPLRFQKLQMVIDMMVVELDADDEDCEAPAPNSVPCKRSCTRSSISTGAQIATGAIMESLVSESDCDFDLFLSTPPKRLSSSTGSHHVGEAVEVADDDDADDDVVALVEPHDVEKRFLLGEGTISQAPILEGLDQLVEEAAAVAPMDPRHGDKNFMKKRPAAAESTTPPPKVASPAELSPEKKNDGATAKCNSEFKSSLRRRKYSAAYHAEYKLRKRTLNPEMAKCRARDVARLACADF